MQAAYGSRFSTGVDLLAWNNTWNQDVGLLWNLQTIGLGTTAGYGAVYSSVYQTIYIVSLTDEVSTTLGQLADHTLPLDPTHSYRLVASTHDGSTYLFTVFDRSQPGNPWGSAIVSDSTYSGQTGPCGLFVFDDDYPSSNGADGTFDNYASTVPAAGAMPTTVTDLSPPPAGKATDIYPTVTVGILDRDTSVDTTSILLSMDGVWIPNSSLTIDTQVHKPSNSGGTTKDFTGATVTYSNSTLYAGGTQHTNIVAFRDNTSTWQTNTWTWTTAYSYLFASNSLPIGSLSVPGFDARMVQSSAANIGGTGGLNNSVASAKAVLAYQYAVDLAATNIVQQVAWGLNAGQNGNEYGAVTNFPGLCIPPANVNSYAIETLAYLQLTAGHHQFYVDSDDTVGIYSGTNLTDTSMVLLESSGVIHTAFDFVVEADGLYPFHIIYEEGGGAAYLVLNSVNLSDNSLTLVNAAGGVPAFYPLACKSSTSVSGPYTADAAANAGNVLTTADVLCGGTGDALNQKLTGGIITIPIAGSAKFYRLDGPRPSKITSVTKTGSNLVIKYQAQ